MADTAHKVNRRFGRINIDSQAVLAFPARNANPRIKAHLFQIGEGGCAVSTTESAPFIGEECLVWATTGRGNKHLGVSGQIVWVKPVYENQQKTVLIGIEFKTPIELSKEILEKLKSKQE